MVSLPAASEAKRTKAASSETTEESQVAGAENSEGATRYVENLAARALEIVKSGGSEEARKKEMMDLINASVDFDWVAKFVTGRYWREANEEQKSKYLGLYREFLLKSYTSRVGEYSSVSFKVINTEKLDDTDYQVRGEINKKTNEPAIKVEYRVRKSAKQFKIVDMSVEGVSLLTTQRSEFNSVLSRSGMDELIAMLERRVKEL